MKRLSMIGCLLLVFTMLLVGCGGMTSDTNTKDSPTVATTEKKKPIPQGKVKRDGVEMNVPKGLPILMYHKVGPDKENDAVISEDLFRSQMKFLKENGYHPLTMDELYDYIVNGAAVPEKPVVLTFDDGYADTYSIVYPIMKEYGFPVTVFVNPGDVGTRLTWEQIKEMHEAGVTIASHAYNHERLSEQSNDKQKANIVDAQKALKDKLGMENTWLCYPYGKHNAYTMQVAKENGIKLAVDMKSGWAHKGDNPLELLRVWVGNSVDLANFKERLSTEHFKDL